MRPSAPVLTALSSNTPSTQASASPESSGNTINSRSWRVFRQDRELIVFPLLSGLALACVLGVFELSAVSTGALGRIGAAEGSERASLQAVDYVLGAALTFSMYF